MIRPFATLSDVTIEGTGEDVAIAAMQDSFAGQLLIEVIVRNNDEDLGLPAASRQYSIER